MLTLGDCAPNDPSTVRKVTFKDTLDLIDPPDVPDGVFIMNYQRFDENVKEKYKLYPKMSREHKFLEFISVVVEEMYLMWDRMYRAVNLFDSYAVILTQTKRVYRGETLFPDPRTFDRLEKCKQFFVERLTVLLNSIEPAYKINEALISLVDRMDGNTQIDRDLMRQMFAEVKDVIGIFNEFNGAFESAFSLRPIEFFTTTSKESVVRVTAKKDSDEREATKQSAMQMYRKSLSDVRLIVIELETNSHRYYLNMAMAELKKNIEMLDKKIYPEILKSLQCAKPINFTRLQDAMRTIRSLAMRALNVEEASSSY